VPGTCAYRVMDRSWASSFTLPTLKSASRTSKSAPWSRASGCRMSTLAGLMSRWHTPRMMCAYSTAAATGSMYSSTRNSRSRKPYASRSSRWARLERAPFSRSSRDISISSTIM